MNKAYNTVRTPASGVAALQPTIARMAWMLIKSVFRRSNSVRTAAALRKYFHASCTWRAAGTGESGPGGGVCEIRSRQAMASTMLNAAYHPES